MSSLLERTQPYTLTDWRIDETGQRLKDVRALNWIFFLRNPDHPHRHLYERSLASSPEGKSRR